MSEDTTEQGATDTSEIDKLRQDLADSEQMIDILSNQDDEYYADESESENQEKETETPPQMSTSDRQIEAIKQKIIKDRYELDVRQNQVEIQKQIEVLTKNHGFGKQQFLDIFDRMDKTNRSFELESKLYRLEMNDKKRANSQLHDDNNIFEPTNSGKQPQTWEEYDTA